MTLDRDPLVDRFRLRVTRDYAHRDEDQQRVERARLRVHVGLDFAAGVSDVYPSEQPVEEQPS